MDGERIEVGRAQPGLGVEEAHSVIAMIVRKDENDVGPSRLLRRADGHAGGGLARGGDVALADAGALQDPLVGRVDHALEIGVAENPRRHVGRERRNRGQPAADPRAAGVRSARSGHHNRESRRRSAGVSRPK